MHLRVTRNGAWWQLDVVDSGPGVAPADRERIFDRLTRLDTSRARNTGGFGLGLPIARGLARAHGGDLVCANSTAGARFVLTVPALVSAGDGPARHDSEGRSDDGA